jgi:hypothetical protein
MGCNQLITTGHGVEAGWVLGAIFSGRLAHYSPRYYACSGCVLAARHEEPTRRQLGSYGAPPQVS